MHVKKVILTLEQKNIVKKLAEELHEKYCRDHHGDLAAEVGGCFWGYYGHQEFWQRWFKSQSVDETHRTYVNMAMAICQTCEWDDEKIKKVGKYRYDQTIAWIFQDPRLGFEKAKQALTIILS